MPKCLLEQRHTEADFNHVFLYILPKHRNPFHAPALPRGSTETAGCSFQLMRCQDLLFKYSERQAFIVLTLNMMKWRLSFTSPGPIDRAIKTLQSCSLHIRIKKIHWFSNLNKHLCLWMSQHHSLIEVVFLRLYITHPWTFSIMKRQNVLNSHCLPVLLWALV